MALIGPFSQWRLCFKLHCTAAAAARPRRASLQHSAGRLPARGMLNFGVYAYISVLSTRACEQTSEMLTLIYRMGRLRSTPADKRMRVAATVRCVYEF